MLTETPRAVLERRYRTDVLVVGAGAAGLRAAIALDEQRAEVLIVGKRPRGDAHTVLAAGGINAALGTMDPEDRWYIHAADTLHEGRMLGDPRAVELLCREAPRAIDDLVGYGAQFARGEDGRLLQRYFGAHRYRRTCFAGDYTGRAVMEALLAEVDRRGIRIVERAYISALLTDAKRVVGALGFELDSGGIFAAEAGAVILATGGDTYLYRRSSSRERENTGDGMALALQAGARLADMELVQFHPTGMVWPPDVEGTLVTEAVRGEGGQLLNASGERFMARYDADRMELSTRDRIALANYTEILEGRGTERGGVWLDVSHVPADLIRERLPRMVEQFERIGVDITRERMEVAPTAHYSMGGIRVEPTTHATDVAGLYAAGEVTAGVHGANRLGGNSLTETVVFGRRAGEAAGAYARAQPGGRLDADRIDAALAGLHRLARAAEAPMLELIDRLQRTMWLRVGLVRDGAGLAEAGAELDRIRAQSRRASGPTEAPTPSALAAALDLQSMLATAEATVRAALLRTESRGAHQRRDHPRTEPEWQRTIVIGRSADELELSTEDLPAPSTEVAAALEDFQEIAVAGRLVE